MERRPRVSMLILWSALVSSLAMLVPSVAGAADPGAVPSDTVVTPNEAHHAVERFWPKRERALARNDILQTLALETGVAAELDRAVGVDNVLSGVTGLRWKRHLKSKNVIVARQTKYPAWFVASVLTNRYIDQNDPDARPPADYLEIMIFTKRRANARWELAFTAGRVNASDALLHNAVTNADTVPFSIDPPAMAQDPSILHARLADYWQYWTDHKTAPPDTEFGEGYWTTERGQILAANAHLDPACECYRTVTYFVDPADDRWVFPAEIAGRTVRNYVCGTVRIRIEYEALPGRRLVQGRFRNTWPAQLDPGTYSRVESESLRQTCIVVDPRGGPLSVVGGNEATVAIVGTK